MSNLVPEGWCESQLGEYVTFSQGVQVGVEEQLNSKEEGFVRFIRIVDYTQNTDDIRYVHESNAKKGLVDVEDIVMVRYGATGFVGRGIRGAIANNMFSISPKDILSKDYLYQYLRSDSTQEFIASLVASSTMPALNFTGVRTIPLHFPPLPEQQKIAEILTSVDEVIEKTQAQINKLKDLKTGMMQELLTRGVGVDGKPHTEFKDSPVGRIPKGWEVEPLSLIAITKGLQTGPFGGQLHAEEYTEKGIPVIMPKNMKSNKVCIQNIARIPEHKAIELSKHRVKKGDVVFSRRGDIGRFVLINKDNEGWLCGTGSLRARLNNTVILPLYLASYLTLDLVIEWLNNNAVGQTMLNLNTAILGELPVVLPPIHEQELIANSIESIDIAINSKALKLKSVLNTKKALMQDLLTGKVRVKVDG